MEVGIYAEMEYIIDSFENAGVSKLVLRWLQTTVNYELLEVSFLQLNRAGYKDYFR